MISKKQKKKNHTWKIQLTIAFNFMSFKDNDEAHVMHLRIKIK